MSESVVLKCEGIQYYSAIDEDLFFEWIKRITCIVDVKGTHDALYLHFESEKILDENLESSLLSFIDII